MASAVADGPQPTALELKERRRAARRANASESNDAAASSIGDSHQTAPRSFNKGDVAVNVASSLPGSAPAPNPQLQSPVRPLPTSSPLGSYAINMPQVVRLQQLLQPMSPNNMRIPAMPASLQAAFEKSILIQSGRLAPLAQPLLPNRGAMQAIAQRSALQASDTAGSAVNLVGPVLAVRIASMDGPIHRDPGVIHPVVRVHVVDLTSGRYLKVLHPIKAPHKLRPAPPPQRDASANAGCFGWDRVPAIPFMPHLCNGTTLPSLNRSLSCDSRLLAEAGVTASAAHAGATESMGTHDGSLLWSDTLVFGIPLSEAISPATALLFEVLEGAAMGGSRAGGLQRDGDGNTCVAWGFLKTVSSSGRPSVSLEGRVPLGLPKALGPSPIFAVKSSTPVLRAMGEVPLVDVELFSYQQATNADREAHLTSLVDSLKVSATGGSQADVRDMPSPDVFLQYRLPAHRTVATTLRVAAFGALIPSARFIKNHEFGVTHTLAVQQGGEETGVQLHATPSEQMEHPLLGRPRHLIRLPTDVNVDEILQDGEGRAGGALSAANQAAEAAAAAAQASVEQAQGDAQQQDEDDDVDFTPSQISSSMAAGLGMGTGMGMDSAAPLPGQGGAGLPKPAKLNIQNRESLEEPSLPPGSIVGTLPTAKLGATALSFSQDGNLLAVACIGDVGYPIRIFEIGRGREIATLEGHGNIIYSVSWSPNGCWLVSASGDGSAAVWSIPRRSASSVRLRGWPCLHARLSHVPPAYVYAARFHPAHPSLVVTGSYDRSLRLWDARLDAANAPNVAPLAPGMATIEGTCLGYIGTDPRASDAGYMGVAGVTKRVGHAGYVNCVEFDTAGDPSGATRRMITADSTGTILVWDMSNGPADSPSSYTLLRELHPASFRGVPITSVRVRPGHNQLLVLGQANILRLFDLTTYAAIRAFPNARCTVSRLEASFSPDGRLVASGSEDGQLCLWEADTGAVIQARAATAAGQHVVIGYPSLLLAVAWSPTAHVLATGAFGLEYPVMLCT